MKIQKFLLRIEHMLLFDCSIDISSIHHFLTEFNKHLSKLEKEKFQYIIQSMLLITSKQKSIEFYSKRIKELELEVKLSDIKNH